MKSDSQDQLFDNKYGMPFDEAISLIKSYFALEFPIFNLVAEYNESAGYWGLKYNYDGMTVFISCGRGMLETQLLKNEKEISLLEFDERMKNIKVASEKNIRFTLSVIKNYLKNSLPGDKK